MHVAQLASFGLDTHPGGYAVHLAKILQGAQHEAHGGSNGTRADTALMDQGGIYVGG